MTDSRPLLEVEEHTPPPPSAAVADAGPAASGGTATAAEGAVAQAAADAEVRELSGLRHVVEGSFGDLEDFGELLDGEK